MPFPTCRICLNHFDDEDSLPYIFSKCGHSVCGDCLTRLDECPFCKTASKAVKNYSMIEMLETVDFKQASSLADLQSVLSDLAKRDFVAEQQTKIHPEIEELKKEKERLKAEIEEAASQKIELAEKETLKRIEAVKDDLRGLEDVKRLKTEQLKQYESFHRQQILEDIIAERREHASVLCSLRKEKDELEQKCKTLKEDMEEYAKNSKASIVEKHEKERDEVCQQISVKRLYKAERSFTETDTYFIPRMDIMPSGQIANVAILCEADDQEDAVVLNKDYIDSGCLHNIKNRLVDDLVKNSSKDAIVQFKIPALKRNEDPRKYRHLNEDGTPKLDSYIEFGDCVIGKVLITPEGEKNESIFAEIDARGYVMSVSNVPTKGGRDPLIRVMLSDKRVYQAGDKLSIRYAQKGTIGRVALPEELPKVSSGPNKGIRPDILFNPIGFPKRQTAGLVIEGLLNKAGIYNCRRYDVSAFRSRKLDIEDAKKILTSYGFDPNGIEEMEFDNGRKLKSKVYFVPLYEQALKHHVKDKIQFRSVGPRDFKTRQPQGGRAKGSGLKNGEMEKDIYGAHGVANVIRERMMISSDEFKITVCGNCGSIIDVSDCRICDNSKPGILVIPYVFKVFIHLMMGMNMDIRLRTKMQK